MGTSEQKIVGTYYVYLFVNLFTERIFCYFLFRLTIHDRKLVHDPSDSFEQTK